MELQHLQRNVADAIASCKCQANSDDAIDAHELAIAQVLETLAAPLLKAKDRIKTRFKDTLQPGEQVLYETSTVEVSAKVTAPRSSFDKDAFIRLVAEQFDIPAADLFSLAATAVKTSAAPVSISTAIFRKGAA